MILLGLASNWTPSEQKEPLTLKRKNRFGKSNILGWEKIKLPPTRVLRQAG